METLSTFAIFLAVVLAAAAVHWLTRGALQPWYSLVVAIWMFGLALGALMIADNGLSTDDFSLTSLPILAIPLLLLPFAKKKHRGNFDL